MRILIIKMSSIGDLIHTFPAIVEAKKQIKNLTIDWLVDQRFIDILKLLQCSNKNIINKIIPIPLRTIKDQLSLKLFTKDLKSNLQYFMGFLDNLREHKYDLAIDAQGLLKSALITKFVKTTKICGFNLYSCKEKMASFLYNHKFFVDKNLHAVIRIRVLLANSLNYIIDDLDLNNIDFGLNKECFPKTLPYKDLKNYIVFLHGTTWESKNWHPTHWQSLLSLIIQQKSSVVLFISNEKESKFVHELQENFNKEYNDSHKKNHLIILSKSSIFEVTSIIANALAVVGVDTGFSHLAGAIGVTTIGLYGASSEQKAGILGKNCYNIQSNYHCSPCFSRVCLEFNKKSSFIKQPCLEKITPELVFNKLNQMLSNKNQF